jgi:adenylate kinase
MIDMVRRRMAETDCRLNGWVMEGFPRNQDQVTALNQMGETPTHAFFLNAGDALVFQRLEDRVIDPITGESYNESKPTLDDAVRNRLAHDPYDS